MSIAKSRRRNCLRRLSVSINLSCHSEEHPKGTCFAAQSDVGIRNLLVANSQKSVKIVRFGNRLPRQSADWRGNDRLFRQPCLSLWERWPSAARTERANKKEPPSGGSFSLSINPLYGVSGSFTQGELEGAKPASNRIKCRAKPCLARRAWSESTIFVPQGSTKITTLFQAVERAKGFFDSLERLPDGRRFSCLQNFPSPR